MLKSLHGRLLAWLVVPLLFLSAAHLTSTYFDTRKTAETIFDKLLVTLALSISEHALASGGDILTDDLLELIRETTNDNLYYKVVGPDNSFIMGYEDIPEPPGGINVLEQHLQFYDSIYFEQEVRIIAVSSLVDRPDSSGWMTTFVAQTLNDRDDYVSSILFDGLFRVILLIVAAAVLLSIGISLGLQPLKRLAMSVQRRDVNDLSAIRHDIWPMEIEGLVGALNGLLERLASNISMTKRFVENAAHQLRTPVTALLPQSELALRHAESDRERKAVGRIRQSAAKIARLTNQLLNLTYAESVSLSEDDLKTLDLAVLVNEYARTFADRHPDLVISLELESAMLLGKRLLLGEVIDNLLDNAVKHAGTSEPIVVRTYTEGTESRLAVADRGPGVAAGDRDKVFERFYRATKAPGGSGLGLAIVKEIVTAHRGTVSLGPGPADTGTCVLCRFPIAPNPN
ncbi:MAG: sensor histidine kinase [Pseudomonadota bacterium]